jgi:hypothetical protein
MNERDPVMGAALRAALEPRDTPGFVARVLAASVTARRPAWQWLHQWARLGIAAAVLLVLAATLLSRAAAAPPSLDAALLTSVGADGSVTTAILVADHPPDAAALFADVVGAEH